MEINININEYLSPGEIKSIATEQLKYAFMQQFQKEADVERVISNLSCEYVFALISSVWDGDFEKMLRDKIKDTIEKGVGYYVFRRKDAWDRTESPAIKILDEECANSRPLIKEMIEKHIKEYPFNEIDRDEIGGVIYDVIMDRILGNK